MKKISIIVPVFNEAPIIEDALNHLINLEYDKKEILIGLEPSNDKTEEIVDNFMDKLKYQRDNLKSGFENFEIIKNKKRLGFAGNVANLLEKSTGDVIVKLDADYRFLYPDKVLVAINNLFSENLLAGGISYFALNNPCNSKTFLQKGEIIANHIVSDYRKTAYPVTILSNIPSYSTQIWLRELVPKINPENIICFDDEIGIKILKQGKLLIENNLVNVKYVGMPESKEDLKKQKVRGISGWMKFSEKYDINLKRYYKGILFHWLKTFWKYTLFENISYVYWMFLVRKFTNEAKEKYQEDPVKLWEKFERRK